MLLLWNLSLYVGFYLICLSNLPYSGLAVSFVFDFVHNCRILARCTICRSHYIEKPLNSPEIRKDGCLFYWQIWKRHITNVSLLNTAPQSEFNWSMLPIIGSDICVLQHFMNSETDGLWPGSSGEQTGVKQVGSLTSAGTAVVCILFSMPTYCISSLPYQQSNYNWLNEE